MRRIEVRNIEGVLFTPLVCQEDERGRFLKYEFESQVDREKYYSAVSINPYKGTIRGIHFQIEPYAEEKIISCLQGSTFEVIVDLRPTSNSFGRYSTFELSDQAGIQIFLPKGIAHGFQTTTSNTIVHYELTANHSPDCSFSIDPFSELDVEWPLKVSRISSKDSSGLSLTEASQKYAQSLPR